MDVRIIPHCSWATFELLERLVPFRQHTIRVYGQEYPQPRLVCWYGPEAYTYSGLTLPAAPMPPLIEDLRARVSRAALCEFNSVLCNLYRDGRDSVSWHADDEPLFGGDPVVASLSFGATRRFVLRSVADRHQKTDYYLKDGTLLIMGPGMQRDYQHALPKTSRPCGARINLTFRRVVPGFADL
jgi:alkylated DNA repair dioxygenase AlkB